MHVIYLMYTAAPPYTLIEYVWFQLSTVYCSPKKLENKEMVGKSQNARQARTGQNMVKSNSPNKPSPVLDLSSFILIPMLKHQNPLLSYVREKGGGGGRVKVHCNLLIKLYCIYVCYTNITLYIAFDIICSFM
jgi:hypothetical protein